MGCVRRTAGHLSPATAQIVAPCAATEKGKENHKVDHELERGPVAGAEISDRTKLTYDNQVT
jgi:hypothetical protein